MELHGELPNHLGSADAEGINYNFKARPSADGIGLQEDAILTRATFQTHIVSAQDGAGSVVLRGGIHDPLDELPVVSVLRGAFMECDLIGSCQAVATVAANTFLPYHHGRHDDWSALDTESAALVPVA
jgi:hypothetical protein